MDTTAPSSIKSSSSMDTIIRGDTVVRDESSRLDLPSAPTVYSEEEYSDLRMRFAEYVTMSSEQYLDNRQRIRELNEACESKDRMIYKEMSRVHELEKLVEVLRSDNARAWREVSTLKNENKDLTTKVEFYKRSLEARDHLYVLP